MHADILPSFGLTIQVKYIHTSGFHIKQTETWPMPDQSPPRASSGFLASKNTWIAITSEPHQRAALREAFHSRSGTASKPSASATRPRKQQRTTTGNLASIPPSLRASLTSLATTHSQSSTFSQFPEQSRSVSLADVAALTSDFSIYSAPGQYSAAEPSTQHSRFHHQKKQQRQPSIDDSLPGMPTAIPEVAAAGRPITKLGPKTPAKQQHKGATGLASIATALSPNSMGTALRTPLPGSPPGAFNGVSASSSSNTPTPTVGSVAQGFAIGGNIVRRDLSPGPRQQPPPAAAAAAPTLLAQFNGAAPTPITSTRSQSPTPPISAASVPKGRVSTVARVFDAVFEPVLVATADAETASAFAAGIASAVVPSVLLAIAMRLVGAARPVPLPRAALAAFILCAIVIPIWLLVWMPVMVISKVFSGTPKNKMAVHKPKSG
ncbi:hypothetical protein BC828DRAFT_373288 [Blastocladiella britannica]|nr:hypothetical protein BC828DRAFT_373288 [Blastocladiella britannica]